MVKIPKRKNQKVAMLGIGADEVVVAKTPENKINHLVSKGLHSSMFIYCITT